MGGFWGLRFKRPVGASPQHEMPGPRGLGVFDIRGRDSMNPALPCIAKLQKILVALVIEGIQILNSRARIEILPSPYLQPLLLKEFGPWVKTKRGPKPQGSWEDKESTSKTGFLLKELNLSSHHMDI